LFDAAAAPVLQLAAELKGKAGDIDIMPTDMSDSAAIDALAKTVLEKYGGIDILVNNAVRTPASSCTAAQAGCGLDRSNVRQGCPHSQLRPQLVLLGIAGHPGSQWRQPAGGRPR
jgi:NAD(P)-dependent dehydrogenase (short-subunit alcohol dehydrogenase family)